jgi:hypothetical protein
MRDSSACPIIPRGERASRRRYCVLERLEDRTLLSPTIYTVDLTGDTGASTSSDAGTLLYCLTQANANTNTAGSEIQFDPMVFATPQTITLLSTLVLSEKEGPEVIEGPGASDVTLYGNATVEGLTISSGVTARVSGLTVTGGVGLSAGICAGGIFNQGTLALTGCNVSGNDNRFYFLDSTKYSDVGAGITNQGTLTVTSSTISENRAMYGGGGIFNVSGGTATVTDCIVTGNAGGNGFSIGGGILNDGTMTVTGSTISGNSGGAGGGIDNNGSLTVTGSTISGNSAGVGGSIDNEGTLTLTGSTISGNNAGAGGAIWNDINGAATVTDCTVSGNTAVATDGHRHHRHQQHGHHQRRRHLKRWCRSCAHKLHAVREHGR